MSGWLGRHRAALVIAAGTLVALAVAVLLGGGQRTTAAQDPDNPGGTGARAVARVLERDGVDVQVARTAAAFEELAVEGATVLVTSPQNLGASTARRLLDHAGGARVVVAGGGPTVTEVLGVDAAPAREVLDAPRPAGCTDDALATLDGLRLDVDQAAAHPTSTGCFGGPRGWVLASAGNGLLLLGAPALLENDQVLRADNAAIALRLLGEQERLVWYVPDLADLVGEDGVSLRSLLPGWLRPALWLLVLATVALMWSRGRRLGLLATEALPVTVRALETTEARGRLYRAAGDRAHAAAALRRTARESAAAHLALPAAGDTLVAALAQRLDCPAAELEELLGDTAPDPTTDAELIHLAGSLAELDREVRRT